MILVVGSTGMVGSEICRLLGEKGKPFSALVRETSDPAKVAKLKSFGATLVQGDLRSPESLKAACQGVDQVICTVSAMPFSYQPGVNDLQIIDINGVGHLIDAAKAAGVQHFIHTTFSGGISRAFPLSNAKRAAEKYLKESGLTYTILRPSFFMEGWLSPMSGFDAANAKASICGTGDQLIAWISYKDVAQFAVASLENPMARDCVLDFGGPVSLSPHQVIQLFEQVTGKMFEVMHIPPEMMEAQLATAADPMQASMAGLMLCYADGNPIDMTSLQQSFAVRLTPVQEFIASLFPQG